MRRYLTWRWCVAHLVLLAAILVMLRLGQWQWDRANSPTGGVQNYAYALQWPLFAVFATVVYVKTMIEDGRQTAQDGDPAGRATRFDPAASGVRHEGGVRIGVSTPAAAIDDDDLEMQEWNARLAALNAATARVEAGRESRPHGR
jgi:DNA-binding transcriptional regulator of glucitol operon